MKISKVGLCLRFVGFNPGFVEDVDGNLSAENSEDDGNDGGLKPGQQLREQDRFLPIANVAKIMKKAVPEMGKARINKTKSIG